MRKLILILLGCISFGIQAQQKIISSENTTESENIIYEEGVDTPYSGLVRHCTNDTDYQLIEVNNGRIIGKIRTFYLNDKLKEEYYLNEDARVEGIVYGLYESGDTIYVTDPFINGLLTGTFKFYDTEGNLEVLLDVKDLNWESLPIEREEDGILKFKDLSYNLMGGKYSTDESINGRYFTYYPNGQLNEEIYFENGLVHGVQRKYRENGLLWHEITTKNGKNHGISRMYDENGAIEEELDFIDGELIEKSNK